MCDCGGGGGAASDFPDVPCTSPVAPCPINSPEDDTKHPATMRVIFDDGDANPNNDRTLNFLNVSNLVTSNALPNGFGPDPGASADPDNFKIEVNDPEVTGNSTTASNLTLEAMKPNTAAGTGFVPFNPPRRLEVECSHISGSAHTPNNLFRSRYLRLVTDTEDLNANSDQCLQADWDPNEAAIEILDQIVRVTYNAADGTVLTQDLPIGNQSNQRRIRMVLHVVRGTAGTAGSGAVTTADAKTRVDKWFRRCYAQAEVAPRLMSAVDEVDPPRNLLVVSNNSGANATGNADNFMRFFIRDIAGVTYTVQAGDTLSIIATRHQGASWQTIYNHPNNAGFRSQRPDPDVIQPGDQIFIPASGGRAAVVYRPSATDSPGTTAAALASRIRTAPELQATVFTNLPRPGDPRGSEDILVRTLAGDLVTLEDELSNDTTQTLTIARVAIDPFIVSGADVANGFSSHNIGSPEQRALVRNYRAANNQIEAFVLDDVEYDDGSRTIRGRACIPMTFRPAAERPAFPLRYSIYMAGDTMNACDNSAAGDTSDENPFTFPHEAGHVVIDAFHASQAQQMMRAGTSGTNGVNESKRIFDSNVNFPGVGSINQVTRLRTHGGPVLASW